VKSLSLHSAWDKTDPFLRVIVEGWRTTAKALDSVTEMVIQSIFPFCLTPELYAARPEYVDSLAEFVRSRPMPPVDAFVRQSEAVLGHDATGILGSVRVPTLITYGRHDIVTSTRFAAPLTQGIADTELIVFEDCAHAAIYENVEGFNEQTLDFLQRHSG
jgi:pimeloyl-ACP methyl ester carboxylesterase